MATQRDYYEVLGVERTATTDEIKRAYRLKVRDCHPDTHPNDPDAEQKYREVNEAFSVLGNQEKRARFDQFGTVDENGAGFNPFGRGQPGDIFEDIFDMFGGSGFRSGFSRSQRADAPVNGADMQMNIRLTLEDVARGTVRNVTVPRWESCEHCHGSGAEPGHEPRECPTCHGAGKITRHVQSFLGTAVQVEPCPTCAGRGKIVDTPCSECGGEGRVHRRRDVEVKIPAGIDHGMRLRVPGGGEAGRNGGAPGNLYILINVEPHPIFQREGSSLHRNVTIPWPLAVMGGSSSTGTLIDGDAEYDVPQGAKPGDTIRVRGKGMPEINSTNRGDLYLHVNVEVPKFSDLSENAADLVKQLAAEMNVNGAEDEGILGKIFGNKKKTATKKKSAKRK